MRTTLDISTPLLEKARDKAHREKKTLTRVVEDALRRELAPPAKAAKPFKFRGKPFKGGIPKDLDLTSRDSIYDWLEKD
jgi:hypothetical protein